MIDRIGNCFICVKHANYLLHLKYKEAKAFIQIIQIVKVMSLGIILDETVPGT